MSNFNWALTPLPGTVTGLLGDDGTDQGAATPAEVVAAVPSPFTYTSGNPANPYAGQVLLSGNAAEYTAFAVGRTAPELYFAVSGGVDGYCVGTVAGDGIIVALGKLFFAPSVGGVPYASLTAPGVFALGAGGSMIFNGSSSGTVTVNVAAGAGTWSFTLPTSGGTAGYVLSTDGNGVSSWSSRATLKIPYTLFDHITDGASTHTDGTEDTLYTDTVAAGQLANNGDMVRASYTVAYAGHAVSTDQTQAYFGGTKVLDSGAINFATAGNASVRVEVIRETSTVVRVKAEFIPSGVTLQPIVTYTRVTGLTLSGTNVLKITGIAASTNAAASDITAKLGKVEFIPAA